MSDHLDQDITVKTLPLDEWHRSHGARMVPFAGYAMPLQYGGIIAEHEWTRASASLFDVSHMGQILVSDDGACAALERLLPADLTALRPGHMRYSLLLNEDGGILDDLMITRLISGVAESFGLVVNGACKANDLVHLRENLPRSLTISNLESQALIALQGPEAAAALDRLVPRISAGLRFMRSVPRQWQGHRLDVARCGYTGEDGFEISLPAEAAASFADQLLADERVKPAGLGARDSLRLEAGLPLYGHDLTPSTDPVSAGLTFALSQRRRAQGGFSGHERIAALLTQGTDQQRVGLTLDGRLPAREGAQVFAGERLIGAVTSGGFSPTLGCPIAMAYVATAHRAPGTRLAIEVRSRRLEAIVTPFPFVPHHYYL